VSLSGFVATLEGSDSFTAFAGPLGGTADVALSSTGAALSAAGGGGSGCVAGADADVTVSAGAGSLDTGASGTACGETSATEGAGFD
jgi:hypothetical protein